MEAIALAGADGTWLDRRDGRLRGGRSDGRDRAEFIGGGSAGLVLQLLLLLLLVLLLLLLWLIKFGASVFHHSLTIVSS